MAILGGSDATSSWFQGTSKDSSPEQSKHRFYGISPVISVADFDLPKKPTGFVVEVGDGEVTLRWNYFRDLTVTHYEYQYSTDGGESRSAWMQIPGSGSGTYSYTIAADGEYDFTIRAAPNDSPRPGRFSPSCGCFH